MAPANFLHSRKEEWGCRGCHKLEFVERHEMIWYLCWNYFHWVTTSVTPHTCSYSSHTCIRRRLRSIPLAFTYVVSSHCPQSNSLCVNNAMYDVLLTHQESCVLAESMLSFLLRVTFLYWHNAWLNRQAVSLLLSVVAFKIWIYHICLAPSGSALCAQCATLLSNGYDIVV